MEELQEAAATATVTSDDRLWAALSWIPITPLWPLLAALALLMDTTKNRPYVRTNAVTSIVTGIVLIPLSIITLGCAAILYLVFFYWAYLAFQGQKVEVPFISEWVQKQGWV